MARGHPEVDVCIDRLPAWQQEICRELCEIIWASDPDIEETIKRSIQPYFVLHGNVCALLATRDHVNLFLYDPAFPDPHGIINQGHGNATARAVQVYDGDSIDRAALTEMLRAIVANNRAGGWRRLAKSRKVTPHARWPGPVERALMPLSDRGSADEWSSRLTTLPACTD